MSHLATLFPHLRGFRLLALEREANRFVFRCERVTRVALCPLCGIPTRRIHSRYLRSVWDIPIQQTTVVLRLGVRKFYCDEPSCPRRIFTERLPDIAPPHGRYTVRLRSLLGQVGQHQGGAAGARITQLFGFTPSSRTLLRMLHARPLPSFPAPHTVAVDDWAWKKRVRYGAVVVDLDRHCPIALLPDRSVPTVRAWFTAHPTITTVARDRSKAFAAAITQALPQAQQVADRWHLAHNLTEVLDKVIAARWKHLMASLRTPLDGRSVVEEAIRTPHCAVGAERYQQVFALAQAGEVQKDIARRLGIGQRTVRRWLAQAHGPYTEPRKLRRRSQDQEWAQTHLRERWDAGEHNGTMLWEELRVRGYHGSLRSVYRRLAPWRPRYQRRSTLLNTPPHSPWDAVTPSRIVGWILARSETLTPHDQQRLAAVCDADPSIHLACHLMQGWLAMIRQHTAAPLDDWLTQMRASGMASFLAFARSVERDKVAIIAGLTLSYSTGPAEGHIHKLKLIKRQAYGKASLAYLQQRLLVSVDTA